jgi:putative FmdB family regulatory protein
MPHRPVPDACDFARAAAAGRARALTIVTSARACRDRWCRIARAKIENGMPIYEYECHDCRRRVSLLVRTFAAASAAACPRCGGASLTRLMSRFATVKSEDARLEGLANDASLGDIDENDPGSVARFMKKMGREFGDDLGDDFESAVDEAMTEGGGEAAGGGEEGSESIGTAGASDDL